MKAAHILISAAMLIAQVNFKINEAEPFPSKLHRKTTRKERRKYNENEKNNHNPKKQPGTGRRKS